MMGDADRRSELERTEERSVHCITCSDEGVPMRVMLVDRDRDLALCEGDDGARSTVEIGLVEPTVLGDLLLVHAGTALMRLESA